MVFTEEDDIKPKRKKKQTTDSTKESLAIKYYEVELPSGGKLNYPTSTWYRDILLRDEKILSTSTGESWGKVLNQILKSLLKDGDTFYNDLVLADRDYLLTYIWSSCYSSIRSMEVVCPSCGHRNDKFEVDLTKIDVKELDDDYVDGFKLELSNGEKITLRLVTVGDQDICERFIDKHPEYDISTVIAVNSMTFDRVIPLLQKLKYAEDNVTGKDMSIVRSYHTHYKFGIAEDVEYNCNACKVGQVRVPIFFDIEFFLPTSVPNDFDAILSANKESGDKSD
jgi:hypothetical protein